MIAAVKANELLGLAGQGEQALAEADRDRAIMVAVHDQERHIDAQDSPVGMKLVPHQQADGQQQRGCDVDCRGIRRLQDQLADRVLGGNRDRNAGAEREAPHDDAIRRVAAAKA